MSNLSYGMQSLIQQTVERLCLSPARQEAFKQGCEFIATLVVESGFKDTLGSTANQMLSSLDSATERCKQVLAKVDDLKICTDHLDERGLSIHALTVALLDTFTKAASKRSGADGWSSVEPSVMKEIVEAVSYIVWAYAGGKGNPGDEKSASTD